MSASPPSRQSVFAVAGMLVVVLVAVVLRLGTGVRGHAETLDEPHIRRPIDAIVARGWSVATAIDYEETKGPAMIWPYAVLGGWMGDTLDDLRLASVLFFVAGGVPLLLLASRAGLRGPSLVAACALYALMPYQAVLGQLVMSEASFVFGALWLVWIVAWANDPRATRARRRVAFVLYGILLAVLMHHRIHAVAIAGAVCLVSAERDGRAGWPWWLASALAGLARVPLWIRWGGLVSPAYQGAFDLGLTPASTMYLLAATAPWLALLLWPVFTDPAARSWRKPILVMGGAGLVLGIAFAPPLGTTLTMQGGGPPVQRYMGILNTVVRTVAARAPAPEWLAQRALLAAACGLGFAALAALATCAVRAPAREPRGMILRLQAWTLVLGAAMYALTRAAVYDRYLLAWAALMPIVWLVALPRGAAAAQAAGLLGIAAWLTYRWL